MKAKPRKRRAADRESTPAAPDELPERWSVPRRTELVLRMLRGEALDDGRCAWKRARVAISDDQ